MSNEAVIFNGLTFKKVFSTHEFISARLSQLKLKSCMSDLAALIAPDFPGSDSYFVAYLDYSVIIGRFMKNELSYPPDPSSSNIQLKFLQKIRIFNTHEEILIWRQSGGFSGRIRRDENLEGNDGSACWVIDAKQALWGTKAEGLGNGYWRIYEDRGTSIILPVDKTPALNNKSRILLKTRNYIDSVSETGQATYADCRFMDFVF